MADEVKHVEFWAARWAQDIHENDIYGDDSYFLEHLTPVAKLARHLTRDPDVCAAAFMHDSVEDHPDQVTFDVIEALLGERVANLVRAVTRNQGESYDCYIDRVCLSGSSAVALKYADVVMNLASSVRDGQESRVKRYRAAREKLEAALLEGDPF